jgi:dienelactone hydrolase
MQRSFIISLLLVVLTGCSGANSNNLSNSTAGNQTNANASNSAATATGTETVTIDSPDGVKIVGTFFASSQNSSPAVLMLHQWQSDRHSYDEFAKRLQAKGINVLSIDGRGFGESIKTADGKTVEPSRTDDAVKGMLGDVGAAVEFLKKQESVDPGKIGIVGASYGSSLALLYAADNRDVKAVALLSPGLNYFGNMPTEPAIKKYGDRPLFMVAAEDDKESADAVRKLQKLGNGVYHASKIYTKGGHGTALFEKKLGTEEALEGFLNTRL